MSYGLLFALRSNLTYLIGVYQGFLTFFEKKHEKVATDNSLFYMENKLDKVEVAV